MTDLLTHVAERGRVMGMIQDCQSCPQHTKVKAPVPFRGTSPNTLMIVGEAPGAYEDKASKPFVGESGQLVDKLLIEAALPPLENWFIANVVCCRCWGPPAKEVITACADNLRAQIRLANPEWVLLLGKTALDAAVGVNKAKITQVHGRPFYAPAGPFIGRWCFPTYHPAAGLRDPKKLLEIRADLPSLRRAMASDEFRDSHSCRVARGGKVQL